MALRIGAQVARIAHIDGIALAALDRGRHGLAAQRARDGLLHVLDRDAVLREPRRGRARCRGSSRRSPARRMRRRRAGHACASPPRPGARRLRARPRSRPSSLTPTGVRMPVASMSMRALIGMVQALLTPGNCSARSISAISLSTVMPARHSRLGLEVDHGLEHLQRRRIGRGGGAPAPCRTPTRPRGTILMILSWVCSSSADLVTERPGRVTGM